MPMSDRVWYNQYPQEIPHTIAYPDIPLTALLVQSAQKSPDKPVIQYLGKTLTYQQLLQEVYRFAHVLRGLGVQKGDRLAIMLPNTPQAVIGYYGALFVGAIVVLINPLYQERELIHQLSDSGSKTILCLDLVYPRVKSILPKTDLQHILVTSVKDYLPTFKKWLYPLTQKQPKITYDSHTTYALKNLLKEASIARLDSPLNSNEELALLQYTGGTTGLAKGVMLSHRNLLVNVYQLSSWFYRSKRKDICILGMMPFFHVYGMTTVMNLAICRGGMMVLVPRFDAKMILQLIEKYRPNIFPGAPTIYANLLKHPKIEKYDLSSIEACVSGSAPLSLELQNQFEDKVGGILTEGYGLTEASPVTHVNLIWDRNRNHTIGLPLPDTDCRIVDLETGDVLTQGEKGELQIKGPQVMQGYWNLPSETNQVLVNGWFSTGDIARIDESGFFEISDRKKDMIITNGYNVYPREVEEVLALHEAVEEAAAIGLPDPTHGEIIHAFVVLKQGKSVEEKELNSYCRLKMAAYKAPRQIKFVEELPKSPIGKVLRRVLKEEALQNQK